MEFISKNKFMKLCGIKRSDQLSRLIRQHGLIYFIDYDYVRDKRGRHLVFCGTGLSKMLRRKRRGVK